MKNVFKNYYNTFIGYKLHSLIRLLLNVYIFFGLISIGFASGNQNITINATATSTTGTWTVTGASVPYSYTFQPNAATDILNLNVADIVACFTGSNTTLGGGGTPPNTNGKQGNVTILTASTGAGVGTGDVIISQPISTSLSSYTQFTLTITAASAINISNTISLKGNTGGGIAAGYPGVNVILNSGTGLTMTGGSGIQTDGGAGGTGGGAGANAGVITMTATTGNVNLSILSTAIGGLGGPGGSGGAGGAGGNVTLTATAGTATVNNTLNNYGGNATLGNGGNGGNVTITAFTSNIAVACNSYGANGGGSGSGGNGGALTMSAPAGTITLSNTFTSNGGTGGSTGGGGNGGAWSLTALSTVTVSVSCSSNGGNGGSVSGNGGTGGTMSFISSASNVSMTNALSTIGGNAIAGNSLGGNGGSITVYSATNFSSPTGFGNDMSTKGGNATGTGSSGSGANITMTGNAANGGLTLGRTYTTSAGTGGSGTAGAAGTLTISTGNSIVTTGGSTNDGQSGSGYPTIATGAAPFTKTGTGIFLLGSTNNNFTGLVTVSTGTLKIGANNALGTNASGTTVSNGATIDINNTNYTTTEALALTGAGISSLGAMTTSTGTAGVWSGVATISVGTSIGAAVSSTLTLSGQVTGSGGLTKVDYGTLALGSTSNNYSGSTTITTGTLQINAAGVIPDASAVVLNGGILSTNGAFSETMGTLTVNAGSFLTFGSVSAHTLTFANSNAISWATGANITVAGWMGTYGGGIPGTTKLIVGTTGNVLLAAQLAKIQFVDANGVYWTAQTLATGEVIPSTLASGNTFYAIASGNWNVNTTWSFIPGGAAVASGIFPTSTKNVVISSTYTVTLTAAAACNNITFGSGASGLTMAANDLSIFGNVNIVTLCPTISTSTGNIVFDGTNNSSQTLTSTCTTPSLGNISLINGANVSSTNTSTTFSVTNFISSTGTTSWINNTSTTLTVTGTLAAPSCSFISNGASGYTFSGATNTPITVGGLTSNSSGTINLGSKNTTISNLMSYTSGTIISTGIISMAANSVVTAKNALTLANLQLGGAGITSTGGGTLTVTAFDFNGQTSFTQTAGVITTPTINTNTGPISMSYSGTPTFIYSGSGVIPSGSYYNLTTTTNTKSVTCSSTITVDGVLTNSSGTITGPTTSGQYGRFVNANPVNNIGGIIGSSITNLSFSGTIQGGTIIGAGTNVLQNSSQSASCTFYTLSKSSISGYSYCLGAGPSYAQTFTVSGSGMTGSGNVIVTGSTNYEVSSDNTIFGASASYAYAAGIITGQPKIVYVRLKAGLAVASYNSESVIVTSAGGATAVTVSNNGSVISGCGRTWTGATSTDWNTNTNWTPTILPTSLDDVTIPNVTNKPVIASGATGNAKAITINASSSLTINTTATLNAYGSITNNSTSTFFTANLGSTVALLGNTTQTLTGVSILYHTTVNNTAGVSLANALTVKGKLLLISGALTTNSFLTIDIDVGGNIGYTSGDIGTVSGTVKVFRAINSITTHYISCPLDGVTANDLANTAQVINPTTTKTRLFKFDNTTYTWVGVSSLSTVMAPSNSYSMWFPATTSVNFTGTYTHSASYTYTGPNAASRFMFVSNPYPSTLDWDAATGWTKSGVNNAVYFWNPTTNSYASYVSGAGSNSATQYIPAMNSFFVAYNGTTPSTATVGMTNSVRSSTYAALWRTAAPDETVRLTLKSSTAADETVIRFNGAATNGFDGDLDAYKMMNPSLVPSIYTTAGTDKYSINSISNIFAKDTIPVMIKIPADGNYILSINSSDPTIEYILVDKKLGTQTAVSTTDYPFTALKTDDIARFELQMRTTTTTTKTTTTAVQILSSPSGFLVRSATANNSTIEIMDMTGKMVKVLSNVSLQNGDNFFTPGLVDGAYLIKVNINNMSYVDHVSIIR